MGENSSKITNECKQNLRSAYMRVREEPNERNLYSREHQRIISKIKSPLDMLGGDMCLSRMSIYKMRI